MTPIGDIQFIKSDKSDFAINKGTLNKNKQEAGVKLQSPSGLFLNVAARTESRIVAYGNAFIGFSLATFTALFYKQTQRMLRPDTITKVSYVVENGKKIGKLDFIKDNGKILLQDEFDKMKSSVPLLVLSATSILLIASAIFFAKIASKNRNEFVKNLTTAGTLGLAGAGLAYLYKA